MLVYLLLAVSFGFALIEEIEQGGKFKRKTLFTIVIKYVAPVFIIAILIFSVLEGFGIIKI